MRMRVPPAGSGLWCRLSIWRETRCGCNTATEPLLVFVGPRSRNYHAGPHVCKQESCTCINVVCVLFGIHAQQFDRKKPLLPGGFPIYYVP